MIQPKDKTKKVATLFYVVAAVSALLTVLCLLLLPFWAFGVPSDPNIAESYREGWANILVLLVLYPAACIANYSAYFLLKWLSSTAKAGLQKVNTFVSIAIFIRALMEAFSGLGDMGWL